MTEYIDTIIVGGGQGGRATVGVAGIEGGDPFRARGLDGGDQRVVVVFRHGSASGRLA